MAKGELVIKGDTNAAMQSFVNAVTYMGGSVTSMNPARPVEFKVSRSGNLGGYGAPYHGTATFVQMGPARTKVLLEINPVTWFTGIIVAAVIAIIFLAGGLTQNEETAMTVTVILLPVTAIMLYLYYRPWRTQVIDKLQAGVHGTMPAYETAQPAPSSSAPTYAAPPSPAPTASVSAAPTTSASVAEQMRQLNELKEQGLITEDEFAAKRSELLKRL